MQVEVTNLTELILVLDRERQERSIPKNDKWDWLLQFIKVAYDLGKNGIVKVDL